MRKDNTTLARKVRLRQQGLRQHGGVPVVLETHGGTGHVFRAVYADVPTGVVFERNPQKAQVLALQRPTWAVYEADCVRALEAGVGAHLLVDVLDLDPYGEPWPALAAFFESDRPRAAKLFVFVNDGMRQKCRLGGAWITDSLAPIVRRYGNDLYPRYLEVCRELLAETAKPARYAMTHWAGYYAGHNEGMTHYAAVLHRET